MAKADQKAGAWVLTSEYNSHDQYGEYFCAVWSTKPTVEDLAHFFKSNSGPHKSVMEALHFLLHLEKGGGRIGHEDEWYNLRFVEFGVSFKWG